MTKAGIVLFQPLGFPYPEEKLLKKGVTNLAGLPLSVLAASVLVDKHGYEVTIISGAERNYIKKIENAVNSNTIIFGISSMTGYQITQGLKAAGLVRELNPAVKIAWGGFHPTIMPEQTAEADLVDIVIRGYGERTLPELAEVIENKGDLSCVKGISYFKDGSVKNNEDREVEPLDNFPPLPYHLINVEEFLTPELGERTIAYMTSRGCPNNCSFCSDRVIYKRRWNAHSVDRVIDDLVMLKEKYNIDSVRIMDSNFFVNEKRVADLCRTMLNRGLKLRWGRVNGSAEILVNYSDETWTLLKKAGCHSIAVGIESGYEKALRKINKPASLDSVYLLKDILRKYEINLLGAFMIGIPLEHSDYTVQREEFSRETSKTLQLINDLMKDKLEDDRVQLFKCTPYPGTELFRECCENGWEMPESFEKWQRNTLFNSDMTWLTEDEVNLIDSLIILLQQAYPAKAKGNKRMNRQQSENRTLLFDEEYYLKINEARWEFADRVIDELRKKIALNSCNDFGAGPGWFTKKLKSKDFMVTGIEGRSELAEIASDRVPGTQFVVADVESKSDMSSIKSAELGFCFGLLYHLENPFRAIRNISSVTDKVLFVETQLVREDAPLTWFVDEGKNETQGLTHTAMIPSRLAMIKMLYASGFTHVYEHTGQLDHDDFRDTEERYARRGIFLAVKGIELQLNDFEKVSDFKAVKYIYDKGNLNDRRKM